MKCKDRQRHSCNTAKNWPNNFHASPLACVSVAT
jgi:hypothetical protein